MEKFAIDLDKVLDDFELDEDENETSSHYDKLQLKFCRDSSSEVTNQDDLLVGLGAIGGWSEPVQGPPLGTRSPPDGQHDDEDISSLHHPIGSHYHSSFSQDPAQLPRNSKDSESVVQPTENSLLSNRPNAESQNVLWPALSNKSIVVRDNMDQGPCSFSEVLNRIENVGSDSEAVDGHLINSSNSSCNLDVLPVNLSTNNRIILPNVEENHPDILDIQSNLGNVDVSVREEMIVEHPPHVNNPEPILLPDLMPVNNPEREPINPDCSILEMGNPAVVTENLSIVHDNKPAIVQESQSLSRIPEVANVHQSVEQHSVSSDSLNNFLNSGENVNELNFQDSSFSQGICDNLENSVYISELEQNSRSLPDISTTCQIPTNPEDHFGQDNNEKIVKFDPEAMVDADLCSELEELEEEQLRLQGAYSNSAVSESVISNENDLAHAIDSSSSSTLDLVDNVSSCIALVNEAPSDQNLNVSVEGFSTNGADDLQFNKDTSDDDKVEIPNVSCQNESLLNQNTESDLISSKEGEAHPVETGADCDDDLSSESTGTDTLSSSGTLTDGEAPSQECHSPHGTEVTTPEVGSAFRETPGTLVTAVYDERIANQAISSHESHMSSDSITASQEYNTESESGIGLVAPFWIPDEDAPNCQECNVKFTVIRRRHHCRACGRVLCAPCCHFKAALPYMDYKEARVCATCLQLLTEDRSDPAASISSMMIRPPNPNNPNEYCSRIPPHQQVSASANSPPPSVMVPVGVLKRDPANIGSTNLARTRASKQVIFSDGIRPGGDLTEQGGQSQVSSISRKSGRASRRIASNVPGKTYDKGGYGGGKDSASAGGLFSLKSLSPNACLIPPGGLPPVLLQNSASGEYLFDPNAEIGPFEEKMRNDGPPVVFVLQKNLTALVKLVKLDCCMGVEVWNVATRGLCNVAQEELVVLLEVIPGEKAPPPQLFAFFHTIYQQANKGNLVTELGHTIFTDPEGFLGSKDHGGFLYIRPSFQCLHKLILPPTPYIFALLIQKWETPWAKVFPLRLMLRLGAEYRYYPCPLVSNRNRKPVYCEIGHTIMNLLVDFRNYAYTVPAIPGFVIHMEEKKTTLLIPRNRYEKLWKALDNSNDHVLALGANFSPQADSHLVTVEDDDGHYSTQAINIQNRPRKVTGASFIVFNGALKSNSGLKAKSSIVEDGLMVQIPSDMMMKLRDAFRNLKDFDIPCGPSYTTEPDELVLIRWTQEDKNFNVGTVSPIDEKQMDGVPSVKIHSATDYMSADHLIRWTEVFIIQGENTNSNNDVNISRLSESLARACCVALTSHLMELYTIGLNRVALRATVHQENVGYEAGAGGAKLPSPCMNDLDTELIPVIHMAASNITDQPIILELVFHVLEQ